MNRIKVIWCPMRGYSTQYGPVNVMRSQLCNGINIACAYLLGKQIAACTIMYQAGSRFEVDDQLGANHFIRATSCGSSYTYTGYAKMRQLQQRGAYITCSSDRQNISYTLRCTVPDFQDMKNLLLDSATRGCYYQWDLDDRKNLVKHDLYRMHPRQRVIDLVQKALWCGPLNNSIFCEEARVEPMSEETVAGFVFNNFTTDRCSIGSYGLPFEEVLSLAERIHNPRKFTRPYDDLPCEKPKSCPGKPPVAVKDTYIRSRAGYASYDLGPDSNTWIAIAVPGCGYTDIGCLLQHALVAATLGTGHMQLGQHSMDRTTMAPLGIMAGNDVHTKYSAFNISYEDTGTFGIMGETRACTANCVGGAISEFLNNIGGITFEQIEIGKERLKTSLIMQDENCVKTSESVALLAATGVQFNSPAEACCMIDTIRNEEVAYTASLLAQKGLSSPLPISLAGTPIPTCSNFRYLGSLIGDGGVDRHVCTGSTHVE